MSRRPGLQGKWADVVSSLQEIVPSYEKASSRIALFHDREMRREAVAFATEKGGLVLDLGAGPGLMSKLVAERGCRPVLLDVSRKMLKAAGFPDSVQAVFEALPFRAGAFDGAVSGFALRDALDLDSALVELARVLRPGGRLGFCDLGKPDSQLKGLLVAYYLRVAPVVIGLMSVGRSGLKYGSIFDTYVLVLRNADLMRFLSRRFGEVSIHETQMGGSIVVKCLGAAERSRTLR